MKKKRLIILFSILAAVLIVGCFAYMYFSAAGVIEAFYSNNVTSDKDKERLNRLPEHTELGSDSRPGYIACFMDFSLTIPGYNDADISKEPIGDSNIMYRVGSEKIVGNIYLSKNSKLYNGSYPSSSIKNAAGKEINNEYDFWEAIYYCIPDDFTLFDADKNKGVSILLESKFRFMPDTCYQFDNGTVKGFIRIIVTNGAITDAAVVMFSNCEVPDSCYQLLFGGFSIEEVKDMLGTIRFD